jgi:hypothetical protein
MMDPMRSRLAAWLEGLEVRSPVPRGWAALASILVAGVYLCTVPGWPPPDAPRTGQVVSVLSWLPEALVRSPWVFPAGKLAYVVSSGLWLARVAIPYSSWGAAASLLFVQCIAQESRVNCAHSSHLTVQAVLLFALWTHLDRSRIHDADSRGTFWRERLVPRWVAAVLTFLVAWFYTLAGWSKIVDSGFAWADGLSLQLYVLALGKQSAMFSQWVLESRAVAIGLQASTLACEAIALVACLWRWPRLILGLALIGFHVGQQLVFGYPFYGNMLLLAIAFLPVLEPWRAPAR